VTWFSNSQTTGTYVPAAWEPSALPRQAVICIEASYVDDARRKYSKVASGLPIGCLWNIVMSNNPIFLIFLTL